MPSSLSTVVQSRSAIVTPQPPPRHCLALCRIGDDDTTMTTTPLNGHDVTS
ncbi:hypothetical protein K443DRAFT_12174 [Laccaria amethystina LaAM-08-1]|uniref:Uncharacterized protein n=1 Tax=Laccaria amethystina LaAM-08-1 TaxID=1095629 RepID=A0A0C9X9J8_9AGAR|nr:hypothetical protein K443DRAFT_12174 [Laccaria amethystina LaAM-08-1]